MANRQNLIQRRRWWPRLLLVAVSTALALLGVEAAYRFKLFATVGDAPLGMSETYRAANVAAIEFDRELGFRYRPNTELVTVRVTEGKPVLLFEQSINRLGNVGPFADDLADADLKFVVCGDSFTAIMHQGETWPDLYARELERRLDRKVRAINLARDGFGVLQMFDLAASQLEATSADSQPPHAILFCFIGDDLTRARVWRGVSQSDGLARTWVSIHGQPDPPPSRRIEGELIDPRISRDWFERLDHRSDDPLLADLNREFEIVRRLRAPDIKLTSVYRSFLYNRIAWGDPFFGLHNTTLNPRLRDYSFAGDKRFQGAVAKLQAAKVPIILIHLPQYEELLARKYQMSIQQRALRTSLEEITGCRVRELDVNGVAPSSIPALFLLPHDRHPSAAGLKHYADAVAELLHDEFAALAGNGRRD